MHIYNKRTAVRLSSEVIQSQAHIQAFVTGILYRQSQTLGHIHVQVLCYPIYKYTTHKHPDRQTQCFSIQIQSQQSNWSTIHVQLLNTAYAQHKGEGTHLSLDTTPDTKDTQRKRTQLQRERGEKPREGQRGERSREGRKRHRVERGERNRREEKISRVRRERQRGKRK